MKTRQGFVSNSSSSSFIVAFEKDIVINKTENDVQKLLFGDQEEVPGLYSSEDGYGAQELAETVFKDMKNQKPNVKAKIVRSISGGWFYEYEDLPGHGDSPDVKFDPDNREEWENAWNAHTKSEDKKARAIAKKFMEDNKDSDIYVFEYGDDDGSFFGVLEHGGTFDRVPHIRTSYH